MTGDVFLSNEEYLQQQDTIKARQQRIIQVREQSKKMAAAILNRMKVEADRQYQQTENRILSEIRQHYSRELASVRQHYHQCINDINRKHYVNHVNVINSSKEERKQPLKISRNERNVEQIPHKQNPKKPENRVKEIESNKTVIDSGNTKKTTISSSIASKTNCQKLKKPVTEQVPHLPENIIIKPKEVNIKFSKDGEPPSSLLPEKKSTNVKKSVNFLNKENLNIDKVNSSTSPIKRYPAHAKKPTLLNSNKTKINEVVEPQILDDVRVELDGNEIYNQLVHDRIRVLEQKEKILRRQTPAAPSITHSTRINKPAKFSEYFSNVRISVTAPKHPATNESLSENLPKETLLESNGLSTDEFGNDVDRVRRKKKLLVLELSNAETQTDPNVPSNSDSTMNGSDDEIAEPISEFKKSVVPSARKSKSPRKIPCLSPIPKEVENSNGSSRKSKQLKSSENHRCKRKLLNSNGVTVTVSGNPATSSTDSTSSALANSYPTTSSSENNVARGDHDHAYKTVQVVVNVLSSSEIKERKSKFCDRQKNAYVIPANEFQKVPNWRKLFDNDEKMTESSYFSPPEVMLKKQSKVNSAKSRNKAVKSTTDEKAPDLGYYVQKLLSMRPESIENLDVSSCSTVTIDEVIQISNKQERKSRMKLPLYQNSFDDTKQAKKSAKLPYYPNSFDNTIDAVCEFVLKSQCNDTTSSDTCSADDESAALFSCVNDDQNSSSVSDSFQFPGDLVSRSSISKKPENIPKSQNLSDPSYTNIFKSVESEHSQDESADNQIQLPSVEELCKRGFVSEQLLNQKSSDDQETIEEEEFLQQLLSVGQPKVSKKQSRPVDFQSSLHEKVPDDAKTNGSQKLPKDPADELDATAPSVDRKFTKSTADLKNESRLLGWMGTTVQRTLQASAINSTSSGDSSDPVRHTYKTLEHLIEEPLDNSSEINSLFHKHFTLSPIKVPDIHLTISPVLKDDKL